MNQKTEIESLGVETFLRMVEPYTEGKPLYTNKEIIIKLKQGVKSDHVKYAPMHIKALELGIKPVENPPGFLIPLAAAKAKEETILFLSASDIEDGGPQPRKDISPASLQNLYEDIKENGQRDPIKVYPSQITQGKYRIRDGHGRRVVIFNMLQWPTIKAINELRTEQEAYEDAFIFNHQRRNLSSYEMGDYIVNQLQKRFPQIYTTQEVIGKRLGLSQDSVSLCLKAYFEIESQKGKLPQEVTNRFVNLPASKVAPLSKIPEPLKPAAIEAAIDNELSQRQVKALVANVAKTSNPTEETIKHAVQQIKAQTLKQADADLAVPESDTDVEAFLKQGKTQMNKFERDLNRLTEGCVVPAPHELVRDILAVFGGEKVTQEQLNSLACFVFQTLYDEAKRKKQVEEVIALALQEAKRW